MPSLSVPQLPQLLWCCLVLRLTVACPCDSFACFLWLPSDDDGATCDARRLFRPRVSGVHSCTAWSTSTRCTRRTSCRALQRRSSHWSYKDEEHSPRTMPSLSVQKKNSNKPRCVSARKSSAIHRTPAAFRRTTTCTTKTKNEQAQRKRTSSRQRQNGSRVFSSVDTDPSVLVKAHHTLTFIEDSPPFCEDAPPRHFSLHA